MLRQAPERKESLPPVPCVFVSYSHDTPAHETWVANLSAELRRNGVNVVLDQWDLSLGGDAARFMEENVRQADRVLMICTEVYVEKFDGRQGGVGYESMIVTGELIRDLGSSKFIPLLRQAQGGTVTPSVLRSRFYLDFSDDRLFPQNLLRLLRELHGAQSIHRPPLGPSPFAQCPPRALTDIERDTFLELAFERIAERFGCWVALLDASNPGIVARFRRLDARQFCAVLYQHGSAVSRCRVRLNLGSRSAGITYSSDDSDFNNGFDECLSVEGVGGGLSLRPVAVEATLPVRWTVEEASEHYWARWVAPLRR